MKYALREKCPSSELFWSIFSRIRTEYGEILRISPYSVPMRENMYQNNSEDRDILRSDEVLKSLLSSFLSIQILCFWIWVWFLGSSFVVQRGPEVYFFTL